MERTTSFPLLLAIPLAAAMLASGGCDDRFRSADASPPRIVEVILADQDGKVPAREVIPSGDDIRITDVPLNLSRIRVRFSKPVDGSTIQRSPNPTLDGTDPAGNLLPLGCAPAANVEVTQTGGSDAASFTASVCYDPTGPDMVVDPAVATCSGPVPLSAARSAAESKTAGGFPALERGATYTIRATGVKDQQGNAISFSLVLVTATSLGLASDPTDPAVHPVQIATDYAGGAVAAYSGLEEGITLADVPPGPPADPATGAPHSHSVNEKTSFTAFGPDILVRFDAPLCSPRGDAPDLPELPGYCAPMGKDTGNVPGVKLAVAGTDVATLADPQARAIHLQLAGGYDTVSDGYLGGDADAVHLVPWLPLEDGQRYTLTIDSVFVDVTGVGFGVTPDLSFQAAAGDFRVQVVQPPNGATGVYPTTDLAHFGAAGNGHGIEFVVSRPLALDGTGRPVGTIELHEGDSTGPLAQLGGAPISADVAALDTRGRWFAIGATVGQGDLALKAGATYTVVLQGLAALDEPGVTIPSHSWSFTTASFSRDKALSVPVIGSANTAVDPVPDPAGGVNGTFLAQYIVGKVKYDPFAPPGRAPQLGGEQFFPLLGAPGKPPPSVALVKVRDARGQACATGCEVTGISGYVKTTSGLEVFANGADADLNPNLRSADRASARRRAGLPHSVIGFLPEAPLDPGSAYQLTLSNIVSLDDVPLADLDPNGQLAIPFTTRPFTVRRVLSQAGLDAGGSGEALQSGARFVTLDGANPLTLEFRGSPDLAGTTTAGDLATDPVALVDAQTGKALPITISPDPTSALRLGVKPVSALAPGRTFVLLVTSKLKAKAQPPGSGEGAAPFSLAFTTADAKDGADNLVCP